MNGSQESPTGSLKSRRKDERNIGEPLHILESSGNDGNLARPGQSKNPTHAEEKRIPHLQSEAIPEAA